MADTENAHIAHLKAVRAAHVEERRRAARNAIDSSIANKEAVSTSWGADIKHQQELIEAIDRAIEEEKNFAHQKAAAADKTPSVDNAFGYDDA